MAENKTSFILYTDIIHTVKKLPDEKAGQLLKHILSYVNDEDPQTDDLVIQIAFEPIKQALKRDLIKWEETSEHRADNGRLGGIRSGEARKAKALLNEANEAFASNRSKTKQNEHVIVSDSVIDSDSDNEIKKRRKRKPFVPPTLEEVQKYFAENGYCKEAGIKAWMGYDAGNWFDTKGNPILNWKQKMVYVWFTPENKIKTRVLA